MTGAGAGAYVCAPRTTAAATSSYALQAALTTLIDRLDNSRLSDAEVIRWGCPVPSFGDLSTARVATLGINPSNREFMGEDGAELTGESRRFHTLGSLGLRSWADVDVRYLRPILDSCSEYFSGNPYDVWFRKLDQVVSGANASFYGGMDGACHLDLIPYATARKWTELSSRQRSLLLTIAGDTLGMLLQNSPVRVLILNGRSVVQNFEEIAGARLDRRRMPGWALPRGPKPDVAGFAYQGTVHSLAGIVLQHELLVLGYNHNLQSSFGVTNEVVNAIRAWVSSAVSEVPV
jgi:hypothetical protein